MILQVLTWFTAFSYIGTVRNIWMLAENQQKYLWIINGIGAIFNILLNFLLIPVLSGVGAAIASVATQFFTNVVVGFILKPIRPNNRLMMQSLNPRVLIELTRSLVGPKTTPAH